MRAVRRFDTVSTWHFFSGKSVTPSELQTYLHQHIPLSQAMQFTVVEASLQQVVLTAPLAPNINHRETVFGGSASAVAVFFWGVVDVAPGARR